MKEKVTVVVINYNGAHILPACIDSIINQDYGTDNFDVIVADNGSHDESRFVVDKFPEVQFYKTGGNLGIGVPTNKICQKVDSKYILLLNYDLTLHSDCISKAVEAISKDPNLFSVDLLQYDWKGEMIVHTGQRAAKTSFMKGSLPGVEFTQDISFDNALFSCAGAMLFDREKAVNLGGFDDRFFLEYEDVDICFRAQMMGWPSYFSKDAKVNHKVKDSIDPLTRRGGARNFNEIVKRRQVSLRYNLYRFVLKVCDPVTIAKFKVREMIRFTKYLLTMNIDLMSYQLGASIGIFKTVKETLKLRSEIKKRSKYSYREVLSRYLFD